MYSDIEWREYSKTQIAKGWFLSLSTGAGSECVCVCLFLFCLAGGRSWIPLILRHLLVWLSANSSLGQNISEYVQWQQISFYALGDSVIQRTRFLPSRNSLQREARRLVQEVERAVRGKCTAVNAKCLMRNLVNKNLKRAEPHHGKSTQNARTLGVRATGY